MPDNQVSLDWSEPWYDSDDGTWRVRVTICNLTDEDVRVLVADNPWQSGADPNRPYSTKLYVGEPDPEEGGQPTHGSTIRRARDQGRRVRLRPHGDSNGDDCQTIVFDYPWRPYAAYTDVFLETADGEFSETPAHGGAGSHLFGTQKLGTGGGRGHKTFAVVLPIPYQASAETVWIGPVSVAIEDVKGLPDGLQLAGTFPPLGTQYELAPGDRNSECAVFIRSTGIIDGRSRKVTVSQRIVAPEELKDWPVREVSFRVSGAGLTDGPPSKNNPPPKWRAGAVLFAFVVALWSLWQADFGWAWVTFVAAGVGGALAMLVRRTYSEVNHGD